MDLILRGKVDLKEATNAEQKIQHSSLRFFVKSGHIKNGYLIRNVQILCAILFGEKEKKVTKTKTEFKTIFLQNVSCVATDKSIDEELY